MSLSIPGLPAFTSRLSLSDLCRQQDAGPERDTHSSWRQSLADAFPRVRENCRYTSFFTDSRLLVNQNLLRRGAGVF
jgi:hypothetical protein